MSIIHASLWIKILAIIGSIIVVLLLGVGVSRTLMDIKTNEKVETILPEHAINNTVINEDALETVPDIVADWLRDLQVVGSPRIETISFMQTGQMRLEPSQEWMTPSAIQHVNVVQPSYVWQVDLPMFFTKGRDTFYEGKGDMKIKAAGLIPIVNVSDNEKINESSLHRFLLELPWYPTAALEPYISWEQINKTQAIATIAIYDMKAEATFTFEDDVLVRVEAMRYKDSTQDAERLLCYGEFLAYSFHDSVKIPDKVNVSWVIDDEVFTWYKIEITNIKINEQH